MWLLHSFNLIGDEIEKYLNPAFGRNLTLDDTAKVDIILAGTIVDVL